MALDVNHNIAINWPCGCNAQAAVWKTMLTDVEAMDTFMASKVANILQIFSNSQPSNAQWQTMWINQGNSLPMPNGLQCLWFDTSRNDYGAQYFVVNGVAYPVRETAMAGNLVVAPFAGPYTSTALVNWPNPTLWVYHATSSHFLDLGSGTDNLYFMFDVPPQFIGKEYHVRIHAELWSATVVTANWTIISPDSGSSLENLSSRLLGGNVYDGFGIVTFGTQAQVFEFVGTVLATTNTLGLVAFSLAPTSSISAGIWINPTDGDPYYNQGRGRITAEFILKTES